MGLKKSTNHVIDDEQAYRCNEVTNLCIDTGSGGDTDSKALEHFLANMSFKLRMNAPHVCIYIYTYVFIWQ